MEGAVPPHAPKPFHQVQRAPSLDCPWEIMLALTRSGAEGWQQGSHREGLQLSNLIGCPAPGKLRDSRAPCSALCRCRTGFLSRQESTYFGSAFLLLRCEGPTLWWSVALVRAALVWPSDADLPTPRENIKALELRFLHGCSLPFAWRRGAGAGCHSHESKRGPEVPAFSREW